MYSKNQIKKEFENRQTCFNSISIDKLFKWYNDIGFIYKEKRKTLQPFLKIIKRNWEQLIDDDQDLLWIFTSKESENNQFASVSAFRNSNSGMFAQHLVSNGNPFLSLKVMLASQFKAEHDESQMKCTSSQNWFRQNNRYAFRVFSTMTKKLGSKNSSLRFFDQLKLPLAKIQHQNSSEFSSQEVVCKDEELIAFVNKQYGSVFTKAEELDTEDICLKELSKSFAQCKLIRKRKIIKFTSSKTGKVMACIVANRAPIGINFSFLENRVYYILEENLNPEERFTLLQEMNSKIKSFYNDFEAQSLFIVTDNLNTDCLLKVGAEFLRTYIQSIWLKDGFPLWYEHINSFLQKIESRNKNAA